MYKINSLIAGIIIGLSIVLMPVCAADIETLVFIRHGEKPDNGLGQINCKGLNRALALPAVFAAKFGKPDALFAPNPGAEIKDKGSAYNYIRPLATIEPTAIQLQMPVSTSFGFSQIDELEKTLTDPAFKDKLVFISWEHRLLEKLVVQIQSHYAGTPEKVPHWERDDFDSIYIVKLDWKTGTPHASFTLDKEGLDGLSAICPFVALPSQPPQH